MEIWKIWQLIMGVVIVVSGFIVNYATDWQVVFSFFYGGGGTALIINAFTKEGKGE